MTSDDQKYLGYRFPIEIISHSVWLYHRFMLSLRDVSELLLSRGIKVSYESIREWGLKFGPEFAKGIKKRSPRRGDKWHLDEMCIVMNGKKHWLFRAVDQDGYELDILLQSRRNKKAAKQFFKKLLKGLCYAPSVMITDKLKSYAAAKKDIMPGVRHLQHKGLNNWAENSHQSTRQQEKQMRRFKSPKHVQRFLSVHGQVRNLFFGDRYKNPASVCREILQTGFNTWAEIAHLSLCA
jgi:putative transposase